ncbi:tRNA dimethylallyltransferase 9-like isoform X1 [Papaver somniferum]|uniref:tRNA dimethylallyltransferase 9-like isoform X1 n=1 Tax=Papaver somniferum TaxID=3469 RepID=UPI000E6F7166|nr:tRNA dimethylallyltransferase 9-like isoform X1 [Papaver somniferum]
MSSGLGLRTWGLRFISTTERFSPLPLRDFRFSVSYKYNKLLTTCCSNSSDSKTTNKKKKQKVIVISGPTGAGKSKLALELAKRINGEIISADSVQVYQGLDIGSAKPSLSDRKDVPHHLLDLRPPFEEYSVGQFFEDARQVTEEIIDNGRVPIVAGGTGLYLRWYALIVRYIYGKPDVPKASPEIASQVQLELSEFQKNEDWEAAVQLVVKAGDSKAEELALNDWYRLRRSLEIIRASGSPPSAFRVPYESYKQQYQSKLSDDSLDDTVSGDVLGEKLSQDLDYDFMCFFLSSQRLDLYRMIDCRCEDMLSGSDGILAEASRLLDMGLLPNSHSASRAIGYRQAMEYLLRCREQGGRSSPQDFYYFLTEFQKASRNFAKRQMTWYRNELIYHWLDASKPLEKVLDFISAAYHDQTGNIVVPESLRMKKELSNRKQISMLNSYRSKNRYFVSREDCSDVLDWIRRTQGEISEVLCESS